MQQLLSDARWTFRFLRRNPLFALVVVGTLAMGIGANTAVFSFVNAFLLESSTVEEPDRLVRVFPTFEGGIEYGNFSVPEYLDLRRRNSVFAELVTESLTPLHLSRDGRNERLWGSVVSGNFFLALGVPMALGRGFLPDEDTTEGTHPVVVLSHGLWTRLFGSERDVVGTTILLNNTSFTIVGVAEEGFRGPNVGLEPELWAPLAMRRTLVPGKGYVDVRGGRWLMFTMGRLKPGVSLEQAEADCNTVLAQLREEHPRLYEYQSYRLYPESEAALHPEGRGPITAGVVALTVLVAIVLLLACVNVAGLLLARSATRHREIGIRLALGAGRFRLTRQLLTESVVLALMGGVLGVGVGYVLAQLLSSLEVPTNLPLRFRAPLDGKVLFFTLFVSVLAGVLCGLAPSLRTVGSGRSLSNEAGGRGTPVLLKLLTVAQLALSTVLLAAAGLALQSLRNSGEVDLGFEPARQLIASMDLDLQGYRREEGRGFVRELKARVRNLPGVADVGISKTLPLTMQTNRTGLRPEAPDDLRSPAVEYNIVDSDYFDAMQIRLLRGRAFLPDDGEEGRRVIVINEALARLFWDQENPVGKRVWMGIGGEGFEVVGVVGNMKVHSLGERPPPGVLLPYGVFYTGELNLHVRSATGDVAALVDDVRREIQNLDSTLPVHTLKTMDSHLAYALLPARMAAGSVTSFALLALLLASLGLYGILAFAVRRETRPLGIRMALGATPGRILALVFRRGIFLTAAGVGIGLVLSLVVTRVMSGFLHGVGPFDLPSYVGALTVLLVTAVLASLVPAYRAVRVDPVETLRSE